MAAHARDLLWWAAIAARSTPRCPALWPPAGQAACTAWHTCAPAGCMWAATLREQPAMCRARSNCTQRHASLPKHQTDEPPGDRPPSRSMQWRCSSGMLAQGSCTSTKQCPPSHSHYSGAPQALSQAFDPTRGEGSFGILAQGSCGFTNSDGTIPFPQDAVAAAADQNADFPGSCSRCYEVRCR